ncbi:MAG: hypothetical protein ABIZ09_17830, partial [Rhodoferax sp.]
MQPTSDDTQQPEQTSAQATEPSAPQRIGLTQWIAAGIKAGLCLPANIGRAMASPVQLFWLVGLSAALQIG